jgi:ligand-binding sensor domain-containing protein/signal transduction histidine kinase
MAHGQLDEKKFTHYTIQDGLSDNSVTGLAQDEKGFLWIGTQNGLNRFDGNEFRKLFRTANSKSSIDEILQLSLNHQQLLLTTRRGIQSVNVQNELLTTYRLAETESGTVYDNDAREALATPKGDVLMSSHSGLYSFSKNNRLNFRYDRYRNFGDHPAWGYGRSLAALPGDQFIHFTTREGMFLFNSRLKKYIAVAECKHLPNLATVSMQVIKLTSSIGAYKMVLFNKNSGQLFFYDGQTDHLQPCHVPDILQTAIGWRTTWYAINDTTAIVTGSKNGLFICRFNTNTGAIRVEPKCYFAGIFCTSILKDKEGRLWIGTEKGLLKQDLFEKPVQISDVKRFLPNSSKENFEITAFFRHQDELYVGTYSRNAIYVLDAASLSFKEKISFTRLDSNCNQVWHILSIAKDTLWFATQHGLVWLHTGNKHFGYVSLPPAIQPYLYAKPVSIAFQDSHHLIWLQGSWGTGIIQYEPHTNYIRIFESGDKGNYLPVKGPSLITEDGENNVWLASRGLTRWNRQKQQFDTLIERYTGFNGNNIHIVSLITGRQPEIIFSNQHNGVVFYNPVLKKYQQQLTTEQGLPENSIQLLLGVNNDRIWIASRNYLSALNQQTQKLISYSFADGIPQEGGIPVTLYHDTVAKRILIGYTTNYMAWVSDSISHTELGSIPFFIDAISTADGRNIFYPGDELTLPYYDNDIRVHVAAINFHDVQNNRLWYRMAGNAPWIILEKQNTLNFNNLAPGTYPLEIKVTSASSRWQEVVKKITITIQPPFWQTTWFYVFVLLGAATIIFIGVRWRIRNIRNTAELNNLVAITEMKALHAQMNPHFIFNSLNSIRELILQNENDKASHYLARFARLIRMNLDHSRHHLISLQQNVEHLHRYLEIEKLRFDDFTYAISVDQELDTTNIEIPAMLLQPLIENAIWHGLKPKQGNKKIDIRFLQQHDQLVCEIEDNGIGINQSSQRKQHETHHSVGIENIKDRIRLLNSKYDINSSLEIKDLGGGDHATSGTLARLTLPLIYE